MRRIPELTLALVIVSTLAGCSGSAMPSPTADAGATAPPDAEFRLRVTTVQALPPPSTFAWLPSIVVTLDGRALTGGAVPAIFPGPLVPPVVERRLTPNGWAMIVQAARDAGLLGPVRDFTGGQMPPGSAVTRLDILADGRVHELVGDANRVMQCVAAPCVPPPGTPEAFGGFVARLSDLGSWLGGEIGPEAPYVPAGYAILVGPEPDDQGIAQPPLAWPLEGGFARFGKETADGGRCGSVTGEDAATLRPVLFAATQITRWRDPVDGSFHGLVVRPLLPGDGDPCEGLVQPA